MKKNNIKSDFPFFQKNKDVIYIDSSLTTLKPKIVIDSISKILSNTISTIGGSRTPLMEKSYDIVDEAIFTIAKFVNVNPKELFFTGGASATFNTISRIVLNNLKKGDKIILGKLEHASNYLSWKKNAIKRGIEILHYKLDKDKQTIDLDHLQSILDEKVKIIAIAHIFNTTGTRNDLKRIKEIMHDKLVVVDATQSVGHIPVDFKDLNIDIAVFTAHKMLGPTGISAVYFKEQLFEEFNPVDWGGKMQTNFTFSDEKLAKGKKRYVVGSPNMFSIVAFSIAVKYIIKLGIKNIEKHSNELAFLLKQKLSTLDNVKIYNFENESANVLFSIKGALGEDVAYKLALENKIYLRAGNNCVSEENEIFNSNRALRASFYVYNTKEEVEIIFQAIKKGEDFISALFLPRDGRFC